MAQRAHVTGMAYRGKAGLIGGARGHGRSVNSKGAAGPVEFLNGGDRRKAQALSSPVEKNHRIKRWFARDLLPRGRPMRGANRFSYRLMPIRRCSAQERVAAIGIKSRQTTV